MGAVARPPAPAGAHTIGVIPRALVELEVADHGADELVVTEDMRERKGEMDRRTDAFLTLPGGIGTLEELLEIWVSRARSACTTSRSWCSTRGATSSRSALVDRLAAAAFVLPEARDAVAWTTSVEEAVHALTASG